MKEQGRGDLDGVRRLRIRSVGASLRRQASWGVSMARRRTSTSQVAQRAGVSPATVSRYLNHRELLSEATAAKVEAAIRELGGDPAAHERRASKARLCLLVNCPLGHNPFYEEVVRGIIASARLRGYDVLVDYSYLNDASIVGFQHVMRQTKAAGVITLAQLPVRLIQIIAGVAPVVQCCEYNPNADAPYVSIDDYAAARSAVRFLVDAGRTKVALLNGPEDFRYARERQRGYLDAIREAGLEVSPDWLMQVPGIDYDLAFTMAGMLLVSGEMPDAIFCASDVFAAAVINAARRNHVRVPEDLMVMGFDDLVLCKISRPTITSVSQPRRQLGYTAAELLAGLIANPQASQRSVLMPTELVVRESAVPRQG